MQCQLLDNLLLNKFFFWFHLLLKERESVMWDRDKERGKERGGRERENLVNDVAKKRRGWSVGRCCKAKGVLVCLGEDNGFVFPSRKGIWNLKGGRVSKLGNGIKITNRNWFQSKWTKQIIMGLGLWFRYHHLNIF